MDRDLTRLLSEADHALGRLDGVTSILPNPDLFVSMYVRHEAVLSSQIEGTQSTLEDVLQFEIDAKGQDHPKDVEEVVNYVRAMNHGLKRLDELPLSLRLIREIHGELLKGVRGSKPHTRRISPESKLARSSQQHSGDGYFRAAAGSRDAGRVGQPGKVSTRNQRLSDAGRVWIGARPI